MPVTAQKAPQVTAFEAGTGLDTLDYGEVQYVRFRHAQAGLGDQGSTADLCYLPAGKLRVLPSLSALRTPAIANGAASVGHAGFAGPDGSATAAAAAAFASGLALTAAGTFPLHGAAVDVVSKAPVLVRATFTGAGGIPDAAVIEGHVAFVRG
jgi:hypothetical protein